MLAQYEGQRAAERVEFAVDIGAQIYFCDPDRRGGPAQPSDAPRRGSAAEERGEPLEQSGDLVVGRVRREADAQRVGVVETES